MWRGTTTRGDRISTSLSQHPSTTPTLSPPHRSQAARSPHHRYVPSLDSFCRRLPSSLKLDLSRLSSSTPRKLSRVLSRSTLRYRRTGSSSTSLRASTPNQAPCSPPSLRACSPPNRKVCTPPNLRASSPPNPRVSSPHPCLGRQTCITPGRPRCRGYPPWIPSSVIWGRVEEDLRCFRGR